MIVVVALSSPLTEWDAFAIWGFKAKVLAHEALRPTPAYFHDLTLSYSHLDYPLMVPFLTAGAYAAMGTVDDQTGKLVSVFLDVLIVPMVYLGLRWKLRRLPAACLSATLAMLPVMFRYGGVGCADLPLAMFYAGSILYVARWIDRQQWPDLILAILFSAFVAFTKNEGMVLALMNGAVLLGFGLWGGRRRAGVGAAAFFTGLLAMDAAWLIWSRSLPRTTSQEAFHDLRPFSAKRVERGDDGGFRVHFEEAAQPRARVAAAKAVRAQRHQAARNPRRNLVGHQPHVIRNGHKHPLLFRQQRLDVGFFRRLRRMQHVPAFAAQRVSAEHFVTRRAPHISRHAVAFRQDFLRLERRVDDCPAAEDVGFQALNCSADVSRLLLS
jgi:hypothetical protein